MGKALVDRDAPKQTLQTMEVHKHWSGVFRTSENAPFFGAAFDQIAVYFGSPNAGPVVDAGCGSGTKTLQLASRGYSVIGLDISAAVLDEAKRAAMSAGLADKITFQVEDLTRISLAANSQSRVLSWGVLMHVPDIEAAVAELARITAPGGTLVVSEGNMRSCQAALLRGLKRLLGRNRAEVNRLPAGIEFWEETGSGRFMTRQADIPWLIREFERHGMTLIQRRAGQFSEIYTLLPWRPLRWVVHQINQFWFHYIRWGGPSFGNLLVFKKKQVAA
jgi:ubiquinone/menaquinone biosynthesis C-methylase UbiE